MALAVLSLILSLLSMASN